MSNDATTPGSPLPPIVLIAAADDNFRSLLEYTIKSNGLVLVGVSDGETLAKRPEAMAPGVLLLESRISAVETQTLCERLLLIHRTRSMLIIALAAGGEQERQQAMLETGADQYLSRPFSRETLMTSIGANCHNANRDPAFSSRELLTFLDLELDVNSYRVRRNGRTIHLTPTEFRLLHHLMKNPHKVYSRDELQDAAWPRAVHLGPRTIDVHIGCLRAALKKAGGEDLIRTVRSVGYALSE
ncbi:winged helix-turn-helix domain-containing protein [Rhizobium mayense]|uniref:Winged helix-turn-helix domain-containing protein n=1 Tax=Rhizobium mayense TaxID=1312184 RepID=A0ABT7K193_9HYPH|nr:winged helix-turn-helix domain-containing protein [Rhizobium mayense]MDL2402374.1 winged helix-turn-helix domain-containing protein [Rhizobium mayense]